MSEDVEDKKKLLELRKNVMTQESNATLCRVYDIQGKVNNFNPERMEVKFGWDRPVLPLPCITAKVSGDNIMQAILGEETGMRQLQPQFCAMEGNRDFISFQPNVLTTKQMISFLEGVRATPHFHFLPPEKPTAWNQPGPRYEVNFGDRLDYSKTVRPSLDEYPPHVTELLETLKPHIDKMMKVAHDHDPTGFPAENPYTHPSSSIEIVYGNDGIALGGGLGLHSDDEDKKMLLRWGVILVFSMGQTRNFKIQETEKGPNGRRVWMAKTVDNSLIMMYGPTFQDKYKHELLKLSDSDVFTKVGGKLDKDATPQWNSRVTVNIRLRKPGNNVNLS